MTNKQNLENFVKNLTEVEAKRLIQLIEFEIEDREDEVVEFTFEQEGAVESYGKRNLIKKLILLQSESIVISSDIHIEVWKHFMNWEGTSMGNSTEDYFDWIHDNTEDFIAQLVERGNLSDEEINLACSAEGIEQITAYLDSVV